MATHYYRYRLVVKAIIYSIKPPSTYCSESLFLAYIASNSYLTSRHLSRRCCRQPSSLSLSLFLSLCAISGKLTIGIRIPLQALKQTYAILRMRSQCACVAQYTICLFGADSCVWVNYYVHTRCSNRLLSIIIKMFLSFVQITSGSDDSWTKER